MNDRKFVLIDLDRLRSLANLTPTAWQLYVLLLAKIRRQRNREPISETNPFHLSYQDFKCYGIREKSFYRSYKLLEKYEFIRVSGKGKQKICEILKW